MRCGFSRVLAAIGLTAMVATGACSPPEPKPWWLIDHVEPIGLRTEVVEQGPWGMEPPGDDRRYADPLPLDTVQVTPFIVDPDGPIELDELDAAWVLCDSDDGTCLDDLALEGTLPPCEVAESDRVTSCLLGRGPRATFSLGLPPIPDEPIETLGDLLVLHRFRMIAGTPGALDTDACIQRLRDREPMFDCSIMTAGVFLGPPRAIRDIMLELGADVRIDEEKFDPFEYRNRHPELERFFVTDVETGDWATVPNGGEIEVEAGRRLELEYLESEGDRDEPPVPEDALDPHGTEVPSELIGVTWRFGGEIEASRRQGNPIEVVAPSEGDVSIFAAVVDSAWFNKGVAYGWLRLRVSDSR